MRYYPIFLDLRGRRCTVVGGGRVAERKVQALLRARASVHVISPSLTPRLALLAARKKILLTQRAYRSGDLEGPASARSEVPREVRPALVFAATDSPETQKAVREEAQAIGALVNAADDARESDFIVPASFVQGDLLVAIATSGSSPALARRLRRQLQVTLGGEYRSYLRFLREARKHVIATVPDEAQRAKIFRQLSGAPMMDWLSKGAPGRTAADLKKWLAKVTGRGREGKMTTGNRKKLRAKMGPANRSDNKRRAREEPHVIALGKPGGANQCTLRDEAGEVFVNAILNPPIPNKAARMAAARYERYMGR